MALFKKDKAANKEAGSSQQGGKQDLGWVLLKPRITEKTALLMEQNKYTFEVNPKANRVLVKQAVRAAYNVNPISVTISRQDSRLARKRGRKVMDRGYKKAVVTLPKGESIEIA